MLLIISLSTTLQAVTTAVGLEFGLASSLFAVSLCFTLITMYDATGVRYHSGAQDFSASGVKARMHA